MKALKIKSKLFQLRALLEHKINIYSTAALLCLEEIYISFAMLQPIQSLRIFITSDLYLRANKSFVRGLSETGFSQPMTEMMKESRKELNNDEIDLTKLYSCKNKSGRMQDLEFKKGDFIFPTAFPWINRVLLNNIDAPDDLKTIFESTRTIPEKADKVPAPENIKASLDTQIEKIKNTSINVKSLTVAHENFFLYNNENMITETFVRELNENFSIYSLIAF